MQKSVVSRLLKLGAVATAGGIVLQTGCPPVDLLLSIIGGGLGGDGLASLLDLVGGLGGTGLLLGG